MPVLLRALLVGIGIGLAIWAALAREPLLALTGVAAATVGLALIATSASRLYDSPWKVILGATMGLAVVLVGAALVAWAVVQHSMLIAAVGVAAVAVGVVPCAKAASKLIENHAVVALRIGVVAGAAAIVLALVGAAWLLVAASASLAFITISASIDRYVVTHENQVHAMAVAGLGATVVAILSS